MGKLMTNPKSVVNSNPLISMFPSGTFLHTTSVLAFIQHYFTLNEAETAELGEHATTGIYYIIDTAMDAIEKQAAALDAYERQQPAEGGES